jgi:hypothetical protein
MADLATVFTIQTAELPPDIMSPRFVWRVVVERVVVARSNVAERSKNDAVAAAESAIVELTETPATTIGGHHWSTAGTRTHVVEQPGSVTA